MGFALMWLDSYTSQGPNKTLNAYFLGTVPITSVPSTATTFGMLVLRKINRVVAKDTHCEGFCVR